MDFALGFFACVVAIASLPGGGWAQEDGVADDSSPNPASIVLRREHADDFVGGEEIVVRVTITASSDTPLYALGLYETLPTDWTFEGLSVEAGPQPDILPRQGATGVLEFGWVSPVVPVTLIYALRIPPKESGARFLTGQVEYRLESGPRRNSTPVLTQMNGVANEVPVLTLRGTASLTWPEGQPFVDPGVTAQDKEDGDISAKVETRGRVDVNQPGEYILTYGVVDSAGNRAESVVREVQVVAAEEEGDADGTSPGSGEETMVPDRSEGADVPHGPLLSVREEDGKAIRRPSTFVPKVSLGRNRPMYQLPLGHPEERVEIAPADGTADSASPDDEAIFSRIRVPGEPEEEDFPVGRAGLALEGKGAPAAGASRLTSITLIAFMVVGLGFAGVVGWRLVYAAPRRRGG
jgi:hypothetical protein